MGSWWMSILVCATVMYAMVNEKPLTKSGLVSVIKEMGVATKDDVREIVGEEINKRGLATKDDIQQIVSEEITKRGLVTKADLDQSLTKSEKRLKRFVRAEIRQVRTDMAKLATDTPTKNEFNKLKERVDHYYPAI